MSKGFFDESVLGSSKNDYPILNDYKNLVYNIRQFENSYQFFLEINDERLNLSEIKALLELNKTKDFLSSDDVSLLEYIVHRLFGTVTIYKILNDFEFIINHLKNSNFKVIFNSKELKFSKEEYKLDFNLEFDENSNIILEVLSEGEFIFGMDTVFFVKENIMYTLNSQIPLKFYRQLVSGSNRFSIDSFLNIKDSFLPKLKETHNVNISKEIENLESQQIETRIAKPILEIAKTNHFIVMQLKYRIVGEDFNVEDYKYAETTQWLDKTNVIKIVRENGKLIKYLSDEHISEDVYNQMLSGLRIRFNQSSKSPFLVSLPISFLDVFVREVIPKIEQYFEISYKDGIKLKVADGEVKFEIDTNLKSRLDLFEFKVKFRVEDEFFDLEYLKDLMLKSKKLVQLKDGTTINIENIREINKWIEFLSKFEFKKSEGMYKTNSRLALELDEFLKDFENKTIKSNEEYRELILELKEKKPVETVEMPSEVDSILRDYQKEGVYWMHFLRKYGFNGILADEMGLGKTIEALTILRMHQEGTHLVVCPKSLIYNWENEIKTYFPSIKTLIVDGDSEKRKRRIQNSMKYDVVITSYSMLQKDYREYIDNEFDFEYLVLDEAHYVKNMKTLSAKAVRLISSRRKLLLTGTPLENNLDELYGTFDLIMPGFLGSKLEFSREFVSKIERNNMIALELLQAKIRPFILRRTKKEVLKELPEKQEQVVFNEMTNKQVAIYNELLLRVKNEVNELVEKQGFDRSRIQVLSALLKLRQICNHPELLDDSFKGEIDISGKYNQFMELLEEVIDSGEKVLVFSQFTSMLDIFEDDLKKKQIIYSRLDGSTKNRQDVVDQFNNDKNIKVFLISLKAGGVGLNLTSASAVFLYDPWWNPMVEKQAADRAHRIGQKNTVNIYKFITRNSIEEKILKLQERKGNLFENLVAEDKGFLKRLEWEDLMELFE